jgi:serine/threonine protein kinase
MPPKDDSQDSTQPSSTVTARGGQPAADDPTASTLFDSTETVTEAGVLPPPTELIGKTLDGRYYVEEELGHGGIGAVYLARDRKLVDKRVVVKVLLEKSLQNEWALRKFQHEKEALARVDHPGIVGILDTGELPDGKPYLVMQFVDGETLRSAMRPEGSDLERAGRLIEQAGQALAAAHAEGIIHRDLKPENIMIKKLAGDREQVKIIDFGIAKVRDSQVASSTHVGAAVGTIKYMAPEQLCAKKVSAATDVYALGVIAYELAAGRRPFNPETGYQLLEMQHEGVRVMPKALRPALSEAAQSVILKALAFEPRDRYQSAAEFGELFAKAISAGGEAPPKRRITPMMIAASLLLAAVVAAALWWGLKPRETAGQQQASPQQTGPQQASPPAPAAELALNYWLTVQKMRDGKPYQEPFESSGQEIFENGWKFRFNASSPQAGHLYLLNEGPDAAGQTTYNLLYPTPSANGGSARLAPNEQMQTGWYVFDENQGTEKFWIVWAAEPVKELEAVKAVVNPEDKGTIKDKARADAVRGFLNRASADKPSVEKDRAKKQTNVRGRGETMVSLVELEHH